MAKRQPRETSDAGNETPQENQMSAAENTTGQNVEQNDTPVEQNATEPTEERPIVDILVVGPNVPTPLVKRYTDAQRAEIARLFYGPTPEDENTWGVGHENPDIIRILRRSVIEEKTSKTGKDEAWPYWGYIGITEAGRVALAGGKSGIAGKRVVNEANPHGVWQFDWTAPDGSDRKPKTAEEIADKEEFEAYGVGDFFDYGLDLDIRQPIRSMLNEAIKGDVQRLAQQVRGMVRIKAAKTHRSAFRMLCLQREDEGESVPEHITYESLGITPAEEAATGVKK